MEIEGDIKPTSSKVGLGETDITISGRFPQKNVMQKHIHYCKETTVYFCLFGVLDHTYNIVGWSFHHFFKREFS